MWDTQYFPAPVGQWQRVGLPSSRLRDGTAVVEGGNVRQVNVVYATVRRKSSVHDKVPRVVKIVLPAAERYSLRCFEPESLNNYRKTNMFGGGLQPDFFHPGLSVA